MICQLKYLRRLDLKKILLRLVNENRLYGYVDCMKILYVLVEI